MLCSDCEDALEMICNLPGTRIPTWYMHSDNLKNAMLHGSVLTLVVEYIEVFIPCHTGMGGYDHGAYKNYFVRSYAR